MVSRSLSSHREVPARLPLPLDLDRELFQGVFDMPATEARSLEYILPPGFAYSGTKSHVLLAACQPREKAREAKFEGVLRGRFTYHLLRYLRSVAATDHHPTTYATLVEEVSKILALGTTYADPASRGGQSDASDTFSQRPHCEGHHKHRILFTTEEEIRVDTFPLAYKPLQPERPHDGEALYVMAGSIQGVTTDTQFVYRYQFPGSIGLVNIALVPSAVDANRSQLERRGGIGWDLAPEDVLEKASLPENATVSVTTWDSMPMKIWCARGVPSAVPLEGARFARVAYHGDADASCSRYQQPGSYDIKYIFEKHDPLSVHFKGATPKLRLRTPITEDDAILNAIAKFNFHLYRYNVSSEMRQDLPFDVRLHPLQRRDKGGLHQILDFVDGQSDLLENAQRYRLHTDRRSTYSVYKDFEVKEAIITNLSPYYGLTVVNRSKFDLFVYVFYFDPADYSIAASNLSSFSVPA